MPVIYEPDTYIEEFKNHDTVTKKGEGCQILNWNECATAMLKKPGQ